jgi:plasmid stabilization system protein ParE
MRRENPLAAQRFRERAEQVLKRLERFPNSGKHLPEFPFSQIEERPNPLRELRQ